MKKLFLMITLAALGLVLWAQTDDDLLRQLIEEDRSSVEALVLYPEEVRLAILQASVYPEALIRIQGMQEQTSQKFQKLLAPYSRDEQQMIWDLTRYPDLISRLVSEGKGSEGRSRDLLREFPEDIYARGLKAGTAYFNLLVRIDELDRVSHAAFRSFAAQYPPGVEDALNRLIDLPEVLQILTDNIRLTVLVGDIYKRDPKWVLRKADSLNLVLAQQQARDLEDWKNSIRNNPQAEEELRESADAFAEEYGYEDTYYEDEYENDDMYYYGYDDPDPEIRVVEKHYYYHYPYWFGYPYWYVYPRWRPYPLWYEWGFYYRPGQSLVIIGFPSYYFTNWFFYHPRHCYYYPHLSAHFVDYYYGHRRSIGSIVVSVDNWKRRNPVLRDDWMADRSRRAERIREFGRMETARADYNRRNVDRPLTQREFLDKRERKYPRLNQVASRPAPETATDERRSRYDRPAEREIEKPARDRTRVDQPPRENPPAETRRKQPPADPSRERTTPQKRERPPAKTPPTKREKDYQQIDKAREHHRQNWERKQSKPRTQPPAQKNTRPPAKRKRDN